MMPIGLKARGHNNYSIVFLLFYLPFTYVHITDKENICHTDRFISFTYIQLLPAICCLYFFCFHFTFAYIIVKCY